MAEPFLVVGAMKSGTTSFDSLLRRNDHVDVVVEKESSELLDQHRAKDFAARVAASSRPVAGEVTAAYMQAPLVPQPVELAGRLLGRQLKAMAILRDPFDRAVSHWEHLHQLGRESRPIEIALPDPDAPYLAFSSYFRQLSPWLELIGDQRILPLRLEDYRSDAGSVAKRVWRFLDVQGPEIDGVEVHANAGSQRVVAWGWRSKVSHSPAYRHVVRPVMPPKLRRAVALRLGGSRGRIKAQPSDDLRERFIELMRTDQDSLTAVWPELVWR